KVISSLNNGSNDSLYTSLKIGPIMKNVRNSAKPTRTWFGGICCVAKDVLTNDRTTIIRVKLVINISMLGANASTVNNNKSFTDVATDEGSELENMFTKSFTFITLFFTLIHHLLPT